MSCGCEDKKKKPNVYYEYELKIYDVSYQTKKNNERTLLAAYGSIELAPNTVLRDAVILKHSDLMVQYADKADIIIDVVAKKTITLQTAD